MDDENDVTIGREAVAVKLQRIQTRRDALCAQANQLAARAEHLARVVEADKRRLARRRDAHDKIVLGALMTMVGLHRFQVSEQGEPIVVDMLSKGRANDDVSMTFDIDLLIGALLTLSRQLNDNEATSIARRNALREEGAAFRKRSKLARRRVLQSVLSERTED